MNTSFTTVVSGLPRSGTSVMMQMLSAGGMEVMTDKARAADEDNPRGYFEFEPVKNIQHDPSWLDDSGGKAVKMVHLLLMQLPAGRDYRVIFMRRDLDEVLSSQRKTLDRQNRAGARLPDAQLKALYEQQIARVMNWLDRQSLIRRLEVSHRELIMAPARIADQVNALLDGSLDESAMIAAVDPSLYRNRR